MRSHANVANQQTPSYNDLRVLVAFHDEAVGASVTAKLWQINPSWKLNRVASAEGVVIAHPTYDVVVMGESFASGMMSCSAATEIVRRSERSRRLRPLRTAVIALIVSSANAEERGADISWDLSVDADIMRNDLHGMLASRMNSS